MRTAPDIPHLQRYARQLSLEEVGLAGQEKLTAARVLIVGMGGLGCPAATYMAAAGVGTLGIVDSDSIDISNLHRQVLFTMEDVGQQKVAVAARRLRRMNPQVNIEAFDTRLALTNAPSIVERFDVIVNAADNFSTTYLVNDICALLGKPLVHAALDKFSSQIAVFDNRDAARSVNYRDLFPEPPPPNLAPSCADAGVIGALPGLIGSMQALEVIKLICGISSGLTGQLLCLDTIDFSYRLLPIRRRQENFLRTQGMSVGDIRQLDQTCSFVPSSGQELPTSEMLAWIQEGKTFRLLDVRTKEESATLPFGGYSAPLSALDQFEERLDPNIPVVIYCKAGARSMKGLAILKTRFPEVPFFSLANGTDGLLAQGANPRLMQSYFDADGLLARKATSIS